MEDENGESTKNILLLKIARNKNGDSGETIRLIYYTEHGYI
jgi:hypothetical protein